MDLPFSNTNNMEESTEKNSESKNMVDIIENMAVETYEMEEAAFNMFDNMVKVKEEDKSAIESSETTDNMDDVKMEETPFEMVDINNMVEFENEDATYEIMDEATDPISDPGNMVEVTFQVAPMTHRISEPAVNSGDAKEKINVTVGNLKKQVFSDLPPEMKIAIKRLGRPTPLLNIVHHLRDSSSGKHKRTYHLVIYDKNPWICGCETTNRLFCFPCLLFSTRGNAQYNNWIDSGINDLQHLGSKMNEHETSQGHLSAALALEQIGVHQPHLSKSQAGEIRQQKMNTAILKPNVRNETSDKILSVTVSSLKKLEFSNLSTEQKLRIKQIGRPTPPLNIFSSAKYENRDVNRLFKMDMYNKCSWMCGCEKSNKLFCFPCLLYSNRDSIWTEQGFNDLNHLCARIKTHECSRLHLNSMIELNLLGKVNICQQLEGSYRKCVDEHRKGIKDHNKQVVRNRNVLSKLIDCINMCGLFESTLQTQSELEDYSNTEIFRGLIHFSGELDASFKRDIENPTVFKGLSKEFQNYLLNCMLSVCQENIKKEMATSNYVSVIVQETTDISSTFQLAVIFRYVHPNGQPVERFWGFVEPHSHEAGHVARCLSDTIQRAVSNRSKLISQSFDGGCVISGHHSEIQAIIQHQYPFAFYVHCYAHDLRLVIAQATSQNQQVRIFFSNLSDIIHFWCTTPQCFTTLAEIFARRQYTPHEVSFLPNVSSFKTRPEETIYRYGKDLIACMEEIETTSKHSNTICKAGHIRRILNDQEFIFWIKVFYSVMPHVELLVMNLQHAFTDTLKIKNHVDTFLEKVNKDNNKDVNIQEYVQQKRPRKEDCMSRAEKEVRQVVCKEIVNRYSFFTPLSAESLFHSKQFLRYQKYFPVKLVDETVQVYSFLDSARLKAELVVIYHQQDFIKLKGVVSLLVFLTENDLQNTFPETYKLLSMISTIPMTTNEDERCFDKFKRINTFLQTSKSHHNRLAALAMLFIEKNMIRNMPNFNEEVMDLFSSQKEWATNFSFKQCDW